jgi:hypothetical protein
MIYTCMKYQGGLPLNNQCTFKIKDRKVEQILSGEGYNGRGKQRVNMVDVLCICILK